MDCAAEREQTRFIKWTHRPDVRETAPALCWIFHWMGEVRRDAVLDQVGAFTSNVQVAALLILANEDGDTGLALRFKSATGTTTASQDKWLAYLNDEDWLVREVLTAEDAGAAVMGYMNRQLCRL